MQELDNLESQEIVSLSRGIALMVMGAGMVLSNPGVRRMLMSSLSSSLPEGEDPLAAGLAGILPDFERYMKLRSM